MDTPVCPKCQRLECGGLRQWDVRGSGQPAAERDDEPGRDQLDPAHPSIDYPLCAVAYGNGAWIAAGKSARRCSFYTQCPAQHRQRGNLGAVAAFTPAFTNGQALLFANGQFVLDGITTIPMVAFTTAYAVGPVRTGSPGRHRTTPEDKREPETAMQRSETESTA